MTAGRKPICVSWVVFLCAGLACRSKSSETPTGGNAAGAVQPNVLLISVDTLRSDHLGCYGYSRNTSPNIDRLAAEGVLFENQISSTSWTLPAHAALFTSLADSVHGCLDTDKTLDDSFLTLAERFKAGGYQTVGFFSGPYLHPAFGLGQGFDHYENCTSYGKLLDGQPSAEWAMDQKVMQSSHRDITNPIVYAAFQRWLESHGGARFFMFIHMWDVHFDFIPPPPYRLKFDPDYDGPITGENFFFDPRINARMPKRDREHLIALYDGEIAWTDMHIGKILLDLREAGLLDNTIVALTSDHGTEFFEHNGKGHRMTLFDEVLKVPLVICYPPRLRGGVRATAQTRVIDVGPTLLELAGLPPAEDVMGKSLVPLAAGKPPGFDNTAVSELFSVGRRMRTIRTLDWKFFDDIAKNRTFYFALHADPRESHPYLDLKTPEGKKFVSVYRRTVAMLERFRSMHSANPEAPAIPAEVSRQLKSLGYVGSSSEEDPDPPR